MEGAWKYLKGYHMNKHGAQAERDLDNGKDEHRGREREKEAGPCIVCGRLTGGSLRGCQRPTGA